MKFNSYIPTKLTGIVDRIWEQEVPAQGNYTVLPSGKVELIFPLYRNVYVTAKKILTHENPVKNYSCFLSGLHTKPLKMTFDKFHTFGIQMKPVAVKALFGMPLYTIKDYFVEGDVILDTIYLMEDKLHSANNFSQRVQWFENFLLKKINETADLHNAIHLDKVINKHLAQKQNGSSKTIENRLGYSRTQTFRLFNDWFGMSAHSYLKLLQFTRTVEELHNRNVKLIDIGYDKGYYDQPHFIHTFKEFADMTPGEYRKQMTLFPGQIWE